MATFDQLSAEQRAIIELVLRQEKSYGQLSDLLGMSETRVRELARDALVSLSPVTARQVDADWRGQLADYVLGQQAGPESTATRGHLRRSEPARAWTRSLLDSLDLFYENGTMPSIPDAERGARRGREREREREKAPDDGRPARDLSPAARAAVRRRRLIAAVAGAAILLLAVLVWPIGVLTGNDSGDKSSKAAGSTGRSPAGIAVIAQRGKQRQVVVQAANLPPNRPRQAYEVWLYNSPRDASSLGAQVTDQRGTFQGAGPLPDNFSRFKFVDVSLESIDRNRGHSGNSVLRGRIGRLKQAGTPKGNQPVVLGQVVLLPVK